MEGYLSYLFFSVLCCYTMWCHLTINSWPTFSPYLYNTVYSELTCHNSLSWLVHAWVDTSSQEWVYFMLRKSPVTSRIKIVSPLSTVDNTRGYARVSHSRQWSNYNLAYSLIIIIYKYMLTVLRRSTVLIWTTTSEADITTRHSYARLLSWMKEILLLEIYINIVTNRHGTCS